jgi:DNA-binding MarR family transcriptional regulator
MAPRLPLPTLLSQVLVAFIIEFDNEFEHRMPHRTTSGPAAGSRRGPWLVSMAMWANFMRFVAEDGVPLRALEGPARITNLKGMQRWGYVVVAPDPSEGPVVRPTRYGRKAQEVWAPLEAFIETQWTSRFGKEAIDGLCESLRVLVGQLDIELPPSLPVLSYADGMFAQVPFHEGWESLDLDLSVLLSRALLAFTLECEHNAPLSLAISANALRVLGEQRTRVRDLPRHTGVSREAIDVSLGSLERRGYVVVDADPTAGRGKVARLTPKGREAQEVSRRRLATVERRWEARFGNGIVHDLRDSLDRLVNGGSADRSPLFRASEPYPDGWRAFAPKADTLPHYPMVLHRGGYPDGS